MYHGSNSILCSVVINRNQVAYMTHSFQALQDRLEIGRLTEQDWAKCLRYFRLDPSVGRNPTTGISIKGFRRPIYPYQLFAIW